MPARRKTPAARQDNRPGRAEPTVLPAINPVLPEIPPVPAGLLKASQDAWAGFWRSAMAQAQDPIDVLVAERWIFAYDEWRRALKLVREERIVIGSMGQDVLNPAARWVASREKEMRALEEQLGIGLKARGQLGITVGQAKLTAAEVNAMGEEERDGPGDVLDAEEAELVAEFE